MKTRVLCILQLCFVFMTALWYISYPFMGELYTLRSRSFLIRTVLGDKDLLAYVSEGEKQQAIKKLEKNRLWISQTPEHELVESDNTWIQQQMQEGARAKVLRGINLFLYELSPFKTAWIFFAFIISLLLLFRVNEAPKVAWLLPLLTLIYLIDNQAFAPSSPSRADHDLYPKDIVTTSLNDFNKEWQNYLIRNWSKEEPNENQMEEQINRGEFLFNLARLEKFRQAPGYGISSPFNVREPFLLVLIYFAWNLYFAYKIGQYEKAYQ